MLMTAMEREQKLEGGAVAIGVEVGVGDFAEVVPVARAGLLAPAAQAESTQLTPHSGTEVGLLGAVEPFAVAVGGGLAGGGGVAALDFESVAPRARPAPSFVCGAEAAADVDVILSKRTSGVRLGSRRHVGGTHSLIKRGAQVWGSAAPCMASVCRAVPASRRRRWSPLRGTGAGRRMAG